jgi:hypothetical protein
MSFIFHREPMLENGRNGKENNLTAAPEVQFVPDTTTTTNTAPNATGDANKNNQKPPHQPVPVHKPVETSPNNNAESGDESLSVGWERWLLLVVNLSIWAHTCISGT